MKQHGALLAKGRILGLQFDTLFTENLYEKIGRQAIDTAARLRSYLESVNVPLMIHSPTNQIFPVLPDHLIQKLNEHCVSSFWEKIDSDRTIIRFATSWATTNEDIDALIRLLSDIL